MYIEFNSILNVCIKTFINHILLNCLLNLGTLILAALLCNFLKILLSVFSDTRVQSLAYTDKFYQPLRILASIWSTIQTSLAAWTRIDQILHLKSNLAVEKTTEETNDSENILEFQNVNFAYDENQKILNPEKVPLLKCICAKSSCIGGTILWNRGTNTP